MQTQEIDLENIETECQSCGYKDYGHSEHEGQILCSGCYHEEYFNVCEKCQNWFNEDQEHIIVNEEQSEEMGIKQGVYQILDYSFLSSCMFGSFSIIDNEKVKYLGVPKKTIEIQYQGFICQDCVSKIVF